MKKLNIIFLTLIIILQGCQVYKPSTINNIKKNRTYNITLTSGRNIITICKKINPDSFSVLLKGKIMKLPKSKIIKVEQKKTSVLRLLGGFTIATASVLILMNNNKIKSGIDKTIN